MAKFKYFKKIKDFENREEAIAARRGEAHADRLADFDLSDLPGLGLRGRVTKSKFVQGLLRFGLPVLRVGGFAWVTRHEHVAEVRRRQDDFKTPYGPELLTLTDGTQAILGLNTETEVDYQKQIGWLNEATGPDDLDKIIRPIARRYAESIVEASGGEIDVVRDLLTGVVAESCIGYLGLSADDPGSFADWLFAVAALIFADFNGDATTRRLAMEGGRRLRHVFRMSIADARVAFSDETGSDEAADRISAYDDTVVGRLLRQQGRAELNPSDDEIISMLMAVCIGFVPTPITGGGLVVQTLFRNTDAMSATRAAAKTTFEAGERKKVRLQEMRAAPAPARDAFRRELDELEAEDGAALETLAKCIVEAMRLNPATGAGQPRVVARDCKLNNTRLGEGTVVLVSLMSAMHDPRVIHRPRAFLPDREENAPRDARNLQFGGPGLPHECFGAHITPKLIAEALRPLLAMESLRRADGDYEEGEYKGRRKGKMIFASAFPRRLTLIFDPKIGSRKQSIATIAAPLGLERAFDDAPEDLRVMKTRRRLDAINKVIESLDDPKITASGKQEPGLSEALRRTRRVHFAQITTISGVGYEATGGLRSDRTEDSYVLFEFGVDGDVDSAIDAIVDEGRVALAGLFDQMGQPSGDDEIKETLKRCNMKLTSGVISQFIRDHLPSWFNRKRRASGLVFYGTQGLSVPRIIADAELAQKARDALDGCIRKEGQADQAAERDDWAARIQRQWPFPRRREDPGRGRSMEILKDVRRLVTAGEGRSVIARPPNLSDVAAEPPRRTIRNVAAKVFTNNRHLLMAALIFMGLFHYSVVGGGLFRIAPITPEIAMMYGLVTLHLVFAYLLGLIPAAALGAFLIHNAPGYRLSLSVKSYFLVKRLLREHVYLYLFAAGVFGAGILILFMSDIGLGVAPPAGASEKSEEYLSRINGISYEFNRLKDYWADGVYQRAELFFSVFWDMAASILYGAGLLIFVLVALFGISLAHVRLSELRSDPEDLDPTQKHLNEVTANENKPPFVQNHLLVVAPIKTNPRWARHVALGAAFYATGMFIKYWFRPGFLFHTSSIHFARWFRLPKTDKLIFLSNYDGSFESYSEDFITKTPHAQTAIWSNSVGFPKTSYLVSGGTADGARFKRWVRRNQIPTRFWFSAYPEHTNLQIQQNARICDGLSNASNISQADAWMDLFGSRPRPGGALEPSEIQSLVFSGGVKMRAARAVLFRVGDAARFKTWLNQAIDVDLRNGLKLTFGDAASDAAVFLAFTSAGLKALGVYKRVDSDSFPAPFVEGMGADNRACALGDRGESAPETWEWGAKAKDDEANDGIHGVLLLSGGVDQGAGHVEFATAGALDGALDAVRAELAAHGAIKDVRIVRMKDLPRFKDPIKEPFGFRDGVSQPIIRGSRKHRSREDDLHAVEPGEIVLGYPDNRGDYPPTPVVDAANDLHRDLANHPAHLPDRYPHFIDDALVGLRDFGRNGSFLVIRQLEQNVAGMEKYLEEAVAANEELLGRAVGGNVGYASTKEEIGEWVAAKMMGRWKSGHSLIERPYTDGEPPERADNDFRFGVDDPQGQRCPYGAHVRRVNPRDSFAPGDPDQISISNRHRILRRGRLYTGVESWTGDANGVAAGGDKTSSVEKKALNDANGLFFMCLNADIERQFEFIQQTWIASPSFHGLEGEVDPIAAPATGVDDESTDKRRFTIPTEFGPITLTNVPGFTTTRGGGYFFMPGRAALQFIARPDPPNKDQGDDQPPIA